MDMVRRSAWGAAPPKGRPVSIAAPVRWLFLHHSAGHDGGPETVRAIQRFHQQDRQWADVAYTWLYSPRDRVFYEGRGPGVSGAHTRGYNKTGHAVCVLGNYETTPPPLHVIDDLAEWAAWHKTAGWGPAAYTPHRQVGATSCPGRYLVQLLDQLNGLAAGDRPEPLGDPEPDDDLEDGLDDALEELLRVQDRALDFDPALGYWERRLADREGRP